MMTISMKRTAAWAATFTGLLVGVANGQILLLDNFDDTSGPLAAQGDGIVDVSEYRAPFGGPGDFVGRTQFRFTLPAENVTTTAPGSTDGKVAVLNLDTLNAAAPGASFLGTDLITKRNYARAGGLRMTTRMRVDAATAAQGGMVAAPFLYDTQREIPPGTLVRDEIDHELLTNLSTGSTPHNTLTNVWNDGSFASPGAGVFITNPPTFNIADFHDYRTDWTPNNVKYYIDNVLVRTESSVVPDDPMRAHWNFWAPDTTFTAAYNAAFNPTAVGPGSTYRVEIDKVQIERLNTTRGLNLLVDPSFETMTDSVGGIGGWQRFNNAGYDGIQVEPQNGSTTLKVYGPFTNNTNASGAWQNVTAAPGQEFEGSIWAQSPVFDTIKTKNNYTALTLQFCDVNNAVIGSVQFSAGTNQKETPIFDGRDANMIENEWVQYTVNGKAPTGTAYARLNLFFIQLIKPDMSLDGGAVWFDNADFYQLTSNAVVEDADFDNDGDVDGADFVTWQRGLGVGTTPAAGDANGDQVVNAADLAIWRGQFGPGTATASATAIPEPASFLLALAAALGLAAVRRQGR